MEIEIVNKKDKNIGYEIEKNINDIENLLQNCKESINLDEKISLYEEGIEKLNKLEVKISEYKSKVKEIEDRIKLIEY